MPANLTPMYYKAEREYRRAQSAAEQVECLQKMLQLIPKHKGTDRLQANLKSRLSEARQTLKQQLSAPKSSQAYRFPRQGAGRIVIIGGPNGGKSRILNELTRAEPDVADFPFTTREPLPAMMDFQGVRIQLIDTPPVVTGKLEPWLLNLVRTADGVLLVFDGASDDAPDDTAAVIEEFAARKTMFAEAGGFGEAGFSVVHLATRLVVTHGRNADCLERVALLEELQPLSVPLLTVELDDAESVERLRCGCFDLLRLVRVFTKPPGQPVDLTSPLTVLAGGTVEDLALQIHGDLAKTLKHAKIWSDNGHDGRIVGREYRLREGDVVELH
ncbi:MAG: TGS domain-containing protein [Planctomycetaceae bacterium]